MQKLIAKYGLAAHLAFLAVAPLVLFPFFGESVIATVLLWLSVPAALWTVLEPSVRNGEMLHNARRRVAHAIFFDPLFWLSLVLVAFAGLRALNTGIAFCYNAETTTWYVSTAAFSIFPGVVGTAGYLQFASAVAFLVLVQACRHSIGRSARMVFLLLTAAFAGMASMLLLVLIYMGHASALAFLPAAESTSFSYLGLVFGLDLVGAFVALCAMFEYGWGKSFPLVVIGIAGTSAGVFAFAPPYMSLGLFVAALVCLAYAFFFVYWRIRSSSELKLLVLAGIALTLGGLLIALLLPSGFLTERLAAFRKFKMFPDGYWMLRGTLSEAAFKSWMSHLWIGTGIDSFPLDFRFNATPETWTLLPRGAKALANGWWFLLAERGIVGCVLLVLPFVFLQVTYVRRLIMGERWSLPHPVCLVLPLVLVLFVASAFLDCSSFRAEVLMTMGALAAVSAAGFKRRKRGQNG